MLEFVFDLFPTHLSTPTLRFLLAKELCLALQQTLHHLRFTYFHRQRHLRGRDKKWPDTFTDTVYQCQCPSSSMSFWILSKAYQLSISAPFSDSKDICTFWWWWDSKFYIRLLLIASTLNYGSLLLLASHFLSYAHQEKYFTLAIYQPYLLLPQGSKGSPRHCLAGQPRP